MSDREKRKGWLTAAAVVLIALILILVEPELFGGLLILAAAIALVWLFCRRRGWLPPPVEERPDSLAVQARLTGCRIDRQSITILEYEQEQVTHRATFEPLEGGEPIDLLVPEDFAQKHPIGQEGRLVWRDQQLLEFFLTDLSSIAPVVRPERRAGERTDPPVK